MSDHDETPETDRAVCPICGGQADPDCQDCYGTGRELTRDEMAALADEKEAHVYHWTDLWPKGTPIRDIFAEND